MASAYTTLIKVLHVNHAIEQTHTSPLGLCCMQERVESSSEKRVRTFNNASHGGAWLTMHEMGDVMRDAGGTTKTSVERKLAKTL
jgi:hypothetical protein